MNTTDSYTPNYNRDVVSGDDTNLQTTAAEPALAAVFADREAAHDAVHRLHDEGFRDTWIGIARSDAGVDYSTAAPAADQTRIESDNWFMRFFGEGDETLHDALLRRGVSESDARAAGTLPDHSAVLTVNGSNHPELAAQIIAQSGGRLMTRGFGATGYGTTGAYAANAPGLPDDIAPAANANESQAPAARTTSLYDEGVATAATVAGQRDLAGGSDRLRNADRATADVRDPEYAADAALMNTGRSPDAAQPAARDSRNDTARAQSGSSTFSSDAAFAPDAASGYSSDAQGQRGSTASPDATAYDDYGRYRAGTPVDESTRLQLREERLRVDKSRISRGEATVGTDVVTETQDIDVPIVREELFIERRPAGGTATADDTPIGSGEVIRVPLSEEKVTVTKVPVITEQVVVGKREVQDTQHISETTRRETLNVTDSGSSVSAAAGTDQATS